MTSGSAHRSRILDNLIGTLRNDDDDDDGNENATKQWN